MGNIINITGYRLKKASGLEGAIKALEIANAAAREAEAEAIRNAKFKVGSYYREPQQYADGDPLHKEAIRILKRTEKTVTFVYIPHFGMDERGCKVLTRKVHPSISGEWLQVSKYSPTISASV